MSTIDAPLPGAPIVAGDPPHLLIVRAPYYREVVDGLSDGAARILAEAAARFDTLDVAGAFELPQAIRIALRGTTKYDGFIALGCVVRGETDHYDHICRATMGGLMDVALHYGIALGSGLLTVHSIDQAIARSGRDGTVAGQGPARQRLLEIAAEPSRASARRGYQGDRAAIHNKGAEAAAAALLQIVAARRLGAA